MGKSKPSAQQQQSNTNIQSAYDTLNSNSNNFRNTFGPIAEGFNNDATRARQTNMADYSNIMGKYNDLFGELSGHGPSSVGWTRVNYSRPDELNEAFGGLRKAMSGYQNFADTGGYSDADITDLRERGISPIRAAYGNSVRELERANTLGGGASNYIAARSRMDRLLPGQMADAVGNVNAQLADQIRQGKLAGLAGLNTTSGTMGGLSADEAQKIMQAAIANSQGQLQADSTNAQLYGDWIGQRAGLLQGQTSLYGTTPGMASTFGNQALNAYGLMNENDQAQNSYRLGLLGLQQQGANQPNQNQPWWKTALGVAGTAAPYIGMAFSDKNMKENISKPLDVNKILKGVKKLEIKTWNYKGDSTTHMGPMAQDVKKHLGIGDGKTLHLADIMGVMLATAKNNVARA